MHNTDATHFRKALSKKWINFPGCLILNGFFKMMQHLHGIATKSSSSSTLSLTKAHATTSAAVFHFHLVADYRQGSSLVVEMNNELEKSPLGMVGGVSKGIGNDCDKPPIFDSRKTASSVAHNSTRKKKNIPTVDLTAETAVSHKKPLSRVVLESFLPLQYKERKQLQLWMLRRHIHPTAIKTTNANAIEHL